MQYCEFERPAIVMGEGGRAGADYENCSQKKSKTAKSVGFSLTFTAI